MHTVTALLCFVMVIHWLIFPSGLLHWHCGNLTIAPVPAKQPWWIWINTSCEFIMNDCITTTKQSTTKPCAYFLGYTVTLTKQSTTQPWPYFIEHIYIFKKHKCVSLGLWNGTIYPGLLLDMNKPCHTFSIRLTNMCFRWQGESYQTDMISNMNKMWLSGYS